MEILDCVLKENNKAKDIKMTQRYAHHCPDSLRSGVEILETDYNLTTFDKNKNLASL